MFLSKSEREYNKYIGLARKSLQEGDLPNALTAVQQAQEINASQEAYSLYLDICCRDKSHPFNVITRMITLFFMSHYFKTAEEILATKLWVQECFNISADGSVEAYDAVCQELSNTPPTVMQIAVIPGKYTVSIRRKYKTENPQIYNKLQGIGLDKIGYEGWADVTESFVAPSLEILPEVLRQIVAKDMFIKSGAELILRPEFLVKS